MKILIVYGTTEGQTKKITRHVAETIKRAGHDVDVHECQERDHGPDVETYDAIVAAASVHQGRYQPAVYTFASQNLEALRIKPSAFISVSLSITFSEGEEAARKYYDDFASETGWNTDAVHLAEGAIRYLEYDFFKVQTIEHVVFKGKKKMPDKNGNPEFTDWEALEGFVCSFLDQAAQELISGSAR